MAVYGPVCHPQNTIELFVKCIHVPSVVVLRSFSGYLNVECVLHVTKERASD